MGEASPALSTDADLSHLVCFCHLSPQGWKFSYSPYRDYRQGCWYAHVTAWCHISVSLLDASPPGDFLSQISHQLKKLIKLGKLLPMSPSSFLKPLGNFQILDFPTSRGLGRTSGWSFETMCETRKIVALCLDFFLSSTIVTGSQHVCFNSAASCCFQMRRKWTALCPPSMICHAMPLLL